MKASSFHNINSFLADENGSVELKPSNVNDLLMEESNQFGGWECWAGVQNITIDNQGDVWRAICRQGEKLGSIFTDFDIAQDTVICKKKSCTCAADLQLSKAKPEYRHLLRVDSENKVQKSFCSVPWVQISTKTNGMYRACCLMSNMSSGSKGLLTNGQQKTLRAGTDSFVDAMNSPEMRDLRKRMLSGERPPECKTCWDKEDVGLKSKRLVTNKAFSKTINAQIALDQTSPEGHFAAVPSYFDLRFGNLCNIKCIMCHPGSSSRWYEDHQALTGEDHFYDGGKKILFNSADATYNWHDSEAFWQELEQHIDNIQQIYLVGGEPLLIERHYSFLEMCVERGVAGRITLEYDTNLTILRDRITDLWKNFKKVILRVSLEDVGARNDYIRFPSRWNMIENNLKKVKEVGSPIQLSYSITWQLLNCLSVTDLWSYLGTASSTRILSNPEIMDVRFLPQNIKKICIQRFQSFSKAASEADQKVANSLIHYLEKHLQLESYQKTLSAVEYLRKMDKIRNTNYKETFPELAQYLDEYLKEH